MQKKKREGGRLLFTHQVARRLNVSEPTVRRWARLGLLRAFKIGPRVWRIREEDLEELLAEHVNSV